VLPTAASLIVFGRECFVKVMLGSVRKCVSPPNELAHLVQCVRNIEL